jgi:hypothetical protein
LSRLVKGNSVNPTAPGRASFEPLERRVLMAAQLYEAEDAAVTGAGTSHSPGGFTGGGFVDYLQPSGESVEWTISVDSAGLYALDLRYANGRSDRPLELKIDGVVTDAAMSFPTTGDWTTWQTRSRDTSLAAGTHTVRLTSIGSAGPNLDSLTLRPVEGTPAPEPVGAQALQAEAAAFAGGHKSAARSGYTGTGYVDFDHASDDYVEWSATVPSAKTYELSFRYANGADFDRPLRLTVNGQVVAASLSFAPTGSWTKWATSTAVVALGAGTNAVRVSAIGLGGPNLDALVIPAAPAPDPDPDPNPDPGTDIRNLRVYHIGNSLTNGINYASLDEMAGKDGREYVFGRNVISGAPLSWIWDHPEQGNRQAPFGRYQESFAQDTWDVLTLQPFDRQLNQDSGAGDVQMAQNFINLAMKKSPDLQTYVYQHWPRRVKNADGSYSYDYERLWLREYTGKWDKSYESRDYNNQLVEELRKAYPGAKKPVLMVPVGDVMFELNRRIEAGQVPGIDDIAELFWDGIHMTNWGAFLTGTTFYATMYKRDPRGLDFHTYEVLDDPWDRKIPAGFAAAVQDVAWDVVKGHPYSGA